MKFFPKLKHRTFKFPFRTAIEVPKTSKLQPKVKPEQHLHQNSNPNSRSLQKEIIQFWKSGRLKEAVTNAQGERLDNVAATRLVTMYAKCGSLALARQVFDQMPQRDNLLWNSMIGAYARHGCCGEALELYHQMRRAGLKADNFTFPCVLKACAGMMAVEKGKEIHGHIKKSGFESHVIVANSLVDMYAKCWSMEDARQVFDKMPERDVVSWNVMIAGCVQNGHCEEALEVIRMMRGPGLDVFTVANVVTACGHLGWLRQGREIHGCVVCKGFESDFVVMSALMMMYAKWGSIEDAFRMFDKMPQRDVVSWTVMIARCVQNGQNGEALKLFRRMLMAGLKPDPLAITKLLQACGEVSALQTGKEICNYIIRRGFESDSFVGSALLVMYAKCGRLVDARHVFDKMPTKDVVSWTAMIVGYTQNGQGDHALNFFHEMQLAGMKPDSFTIASLVSSCASFGFLCLGKELHGYMLRRQFESKLSISNTLIDMYAKCGRMEDARKVFYQMPQRDVVSWTAMIGGYGMHGHGQLALKFFQDMQKEGVKPNHVTYTGVLSACSHACLADEGWMCFQLMTENHHITPTMEHYACMVDLLGRTRCVEKALDLIMKMPLEPNASVWGALLSACRLNCNVNVGEFVAERLFELEPNSKGNYVLLSNIYAAAGRWDDVAKIRDLIKDKGLKRSPGCSWIELYNKMHVFTAGNISHPQTENIYENWDNLAGKMKVAGHVPEYKLCATAT